MSVIMSNDELAARAYDEAQRLLEREFGYHNPGVCEIYAGGIHSTQKENFYQLVEDEFDARGKKVTRYGEFFSIDEFQTQK